MIKRSLKNYLVSLKYILIPLGTLFLGLIIGFSIFIPVAGSALHTLVEDTINILSSVSVDPQALFSQIVDSALALDWNNPVQAVLTIVSPEWLEATLTDGVVAVFGGEETISSYPAQITAAVDGASASVAGGFSSLLLFAVLGLVAGYFILKFQLRKVMARRPFWKVILAAVVDFVLVGALTALSVWLASLWKFSLIFTFVISILAVGLVALFEAYIIHGLGKIKFKEIFTLKNALLLVASNFIIFVVWGAITAIISYAINNIAGVLIGLVLLEVTAIVVNLNAEAYVKDYCENHT